MPWSTGCVGHLVEFATFVKCSGPKLLPPRLCSGSGMPGEICSSITCVRSKCRVPSFRGCLIMGTPGTVTGVTRHGQCIFHPPNFFLKVFQYSRTRTCHGHKTSLTSRSHGGYHSNVLQRMLQTMEQRTIHVTQLIVKPLETIDLPYCFSQYRYYFDTRLRISIMHTRLVPKPQGVSWVSRAFKGLIYSCENPKSN